MLEMRYISKSFSGKNQVEVLKQVDFKLKEGEITGLMGESGSGKSTLARILLQLEKPDSGQVLYNGQAVNRKNKKEFLQFCRDIQYISQHPESFFDPFWTLGRSVREAGKIHSIPENAMEKRLEEMMGQVKLDMSVLERYPYQVSGGEIQRISLCRALLLEPKVLILDEATSMLDVSVQAQILHLLRELKQTYDLTYLFISHDLSVVEWFCDRVFEVKNGKVEAISKKALGCRLEDLLEYDTGAVDCDGY